MKWWDWRARIQQELDELTREGFRIDDSEPLADHGPLEITVHGPIDGRETTFLVTYPNLFPFFRFEVRSPDLTLPLHQNPLSGDLCLLGRAAYFDPVDDTTARFLKERLPALLQAAHAATPEEAADLEEHQAEPVTEYYPRGGTLLVDGGWLLPPVAVRGHVVLGAPLGDNPPFGRVAILELRDDRGALLHRLESRVAKLFPVKLQGLWIRREDHLIEADPERYFGKIATADRNRNVPENPLQGGEESQAFYVVVAPEESEWRKQNGVGWIGVTRIQRRQRKTARRGRRSGGPPHGRYAFLGAGRVGQMDLSLRVPELEELQKRSVVVVGLGSIGAPIAFALAQAGVQTMALVDHDHVDPGTAVRWPMGISAAGLPKARAVASWIEYNNPYTQGISKELKIGAINRSDDLQVLEELTDGADLLIDATADYNVQNFLNLFAHAHQLSFMTVDGTLGGWGGQIFRADRNSGSGCWWCFNQLQNDGVIRRPPAGDPEVQTVQPQGCGDPTFTGAGIDMQAIALAAARGAVEMLSSGYPRADWDALIVALRTPAGDALVPTFEGVSVPPHHACPICSRRSRASGSVANP